jgi:hypothetical protein
MEHTIRLSNVGIDEHKTLIHLVAHRNAALLLWTRQFILGSVGQKLYCGVDAFEEHKNLICCLQWASENLYMCN